MNNTIALDIGRVCVNLNYELCAQKLGFSSTNELLCCHKIWQLNDLMETGKICSKEFVAQAQSILPHKTSQEITEAWLAIIGEEIEGIHQVVTSLRARGMRIVFLSNTSPLHFDHIKTNVSFYEDVEGAVLSYEVGFMKPHTAIYEYFEEKFTRPRLFIDDKEENIIAAQKRGWQCYHMGSVRGLSLQIDAINL